MERKVLEKVASSILRELFIYDANCHIHSVIDRTLSMEIPGYSNLPTSHQSRMIKETQEFLKMIVQV